MYTDARGREVNVYTVEVFFKRTVRRIAPSDADDAINELLVRLERNGQIVDRDDPIVETRGGCKAIVGLPEPQSLRPSLYSQLVCRERRIRRLGIEPPVVRILGTDLGFALICTRRQFSAFILETSFLWTELPIQCCGCRGFVPFYRFRHTTEYGSYEDILFWTRRYRALDKLWFNGGVGEQFAYRELSHHDSDLSKTGRDICRRIEKRAGVCTYYYLYRWYGRSVAAERRRPCPGCGRKWLLKEPWHWPCTLRRDQCRLVSNIGWDVR